VELKPGVPRDLVCVCDKKSRLQVSTFGLICESEVCFHSDALRAFPIVDGVPVVISEELCDTVCEVGEVRSPVLRSTKGGGFLGKIFSQNSSVTIANCERFVKEVKHLSSNPRVLIVGSGTKGQGTESLWADNQINLVGIDIYFSETVDVICDAHYLPFGDKTFHGVWVQAVLEHVVEPNVVVAEIERVLVDSGLVYAETPFMQQVHEGAYDFTRFTVLGHRYLFRHFQALDFGGNKGAEVVLAWAVKYFIWSVARSRLFARVSGVLVGFLLRPFASLTTQKSLFDSSSGVFFLGRKGIEVPPLTHKNLVSLYRGQF